MGKHMTERGMGSTLVQQWDEENSSQRAEANTKERSRYEFANVQLHQMCTCCYKENIHANTYHTVTSSSAFTHLIH